MVSSKIKIVFLILIQIIIISTSFLILVSLENERSVFGDAINSAGKNRYYSAILMHEITEYTITPEPSKILSVLDNLEQNLDTLKPVIQKKSHIIQIPNTIQFDFLHILDDFQILKSEIHQDIEMGDISESREVFLDNLLFDYVEDTDSLTKNISTYVDSISFQIIFLELFLGILNVIIDVWLILMIVRILRKEIEKQRNMEKKLEVKTKISLIGMLTSRLAHDIRNPLTVIKGTIDIMRATDLNLNKKHLEYFDRMDESVKRISHQVDEVLDYIKDKPLKLEENDLSTIIDSAMGSIDIPTNIQIRKTGDESKIICDAHMIIVVLINLINNAMHAIGKQNGTIEINVNDSIDNVIITVTDSGSGISEEALSHIFEPMFTTKQEGTGLGLVSCKSIVGQHKGTIYVQNNPTRFTINLPKKQSKSNP